MARVVIEHHFGAKPKRVEHQGSGLTNFVFLVLHAEGEFIVRISPDASRMTAFIKEQWATAQAKEAGVPTAEILEVGNAVIPHPYMVVRRVRGTDAIRAPIDRMAVLQQMGRYAARIHTIPTGGFGSVFDWSSNQLSRNATWKAFLEAELGLDARLDTLRRARMLTPASLKRLRTVLEGAGRPAPVPKLNHGDIRLKNVMVDATGHITALIDWEDCVSSLAPQWDLSIALHDLSIDEKEQFLTGYGLSQEEVRYAAAVVKALNVINYAPYIAQLAEQGDASALEVYRTRLGGGLDLYSL